MAKTPPDKLKYAFKIEVLSCADNGEWVTRYGLALTDRKMDFIRRACHYVETTVDVTERGVRVTFIGLYDETDGHVTECNPFTLTWLRESKPI